MQKFALQKLFCNFLFLTFITISSARSVRAEDSQEKSGLTADQKKKMVQLFIKFRQAQRTPRTRARHLQEMLVLDPTAIDRVKDSIENEISRFKKKMVRPTQLKKLTEKMQPLRKKMVDLRKEPNLTKEKIVEIGDPTLKDLTLLFDRRQAILEKYNQRTKKIKADLDHQIIFLEQIKSNRKQKDAPKIKLPLGKYILQLLQVLAASQDTTDIRDAMVIQQNQKLLEKLDRQEAAGIKGLNRMRMICGLSALKLDLKLCDAARGHSSDMVKHSFFAHVSPVEGKKRFTDRAKLAGTTASGENIYSGSTSSQAALRGWFHSPGHHKNMMASHNRQGLGRNNKTWTQLFGR